MSLFSGRTASRLQDSPQCGEKKLLLNTMRPAGFFQRVKGSDRTSDTEHPVSQEYRNGRRQLSHHIIDYLI